MQKTITSQPAYPRLFRLARIAALAIAALLSMLAVYQWLITFQQVLQQPFAILPGAGWSAAPLEAGLAGLGLPSGFFAAYALAFTLLFDLAFLSCGWLILWRKGRDWFGLYLGLILLIWANGVGVSYFAPSSFTWLATLNLYLASIGWPGLFLLLYFFPSGHIAPRWARWFAAGLGLIIISGLLYSILTGEAFSFIITAPLVAICLLVGGYAQVYRYRHSGLLERQQVKWVVLALLIFILVIFIILLLGNILRISDPSISNPTTALVASLALLTASHLAFISLPVSMVLAMLRYRLWDVDVILRRTLIYTALTLTLGLVFFGSITLLQMVFSAVTGQRSAVATVISTLLIAALFTPLRRRIQHDIDRRFFRQKYNAEQAIERFAAAARSETDIDRLTAELLAVVSETMQPESMSLWLKPQAKRELREYE
jgi:hypothetical protein